MARARRMEAPMAEEPKESTPFDISDLETTSPETPRAKRAKSEAVKPRRGPKPAGEPSLPGVNERPPKKPGRKVSSEGKKIAFAAGEISPPKSEVEEDLEWVRESAAQSAKDAQLAKEENLKMRSEMAARVDAAMAEEDARLASGAKTEVEQSLDELRGISRDKQAEAAEAAAARERRIAEMGSRVERAMEAEEREKAAKAAEARDRRVAEMGERVDSAMDAEDKTLTETEEAWFKKGEEEEMEAIRAGIDAYGNAPLIETPAEIDANVRQAEAMIAAGDLNPEIFNTKDYRYLLSEKARIDADLEVAGWWKARSLRAELRDVTKELSDYEHQVQSVMRERAQARDQARKPPEKPWSRPVVAKEGSGTTVHKKGFFSRLFGKK